MCEYCDKTEVSVTELEDDEEIECEWVSEEHGPGVCDNPAVFAVSTWYVEEHLCEAHKIEAEKLLSEGFGDFMEAVGFSSACEFHPITQEETCDYFPPPISTDLKPCENKAVYAKYGLDNAAMCAEHATEMSEEKEKT